MRCTSGRFYINCSIGGRDCRRRCFEKEMSPPCRPVTHIGPFSFQQAAFGFG